MPYGIKSIWKGVVACTVPVVQATMMQDIVKDEADICQSHLKPVNQKWRPFRTPYLYTICIITNIT